MTHTLLIGYGYGMVWYLFLPPIGSIEVVNGTKSVNIFSINLVLFSNSVHCTELENSTKIVHIYVAKYYFVEYTKLVITFYLT